MESETGTDEPSTTAPPTSTRTEESERRSTPADEAGEDGGSLDETGAGIRVQGLWIAIAGAPFCAMTFS